MHCQAKHHIHRPTPPPVVDLDVGGSHQQARVGHVEREEAAALLGDAATGGYLSLEEMEARLEAVWAATTGAELSVITSDLPQHLRQARAVRRQANQEQRMLRASLGPHLASYLAVMTLLVLIWVLVGLSSGSWYPWPVWPALGWGIGVASHLGRARAARATLP